MNSPLGLGRSRAFEGSPIHFPDRPRASAVAFYLPQFHPIPENDQAWGPGFTEWTNVARAHPEFADHVQPRLPRDLGFYDLRLAEVQVEQARMAEAAGIAAFCYYFYWFDGHEPLILPIRRHVQDERITLPFMLCFANENWTKRWDGQDQDVILAQNYGPDFAGRFYDAIAPFLRSPKYFRHGGALPLSIYRPGLIPGFAEVVARLRERARADGLPPLHVMTGLGFEHQGSVPAGCDETYEFQPLFGRKMGSIIPNLPEKRQVIGKAPESRAQVRDYRGFVMAERHAGEPVRAIPCVMGDWDNSPRRPLSGHVYHGATPELLRDWVSRIVGGLASPDDLLFVNAWNEWAEGTYLEPDQRLGWAMLNALGAGLREPEDQGGGSGQPITVFAHIHYPEVWTTMLPRFERFKADYRLVLTTTGAAGALPLPGGLSPERVEVFEVDNLGRDIRPFLHAFARTRFPLDLCLKIHTKKSMHRQDGDVWREHILDQIIGGEMSPERVADCFARMPNLGLVGPDEHFVPLAEFVGSNEGTIEAAMIALGIDGRASDVALGRFVAGSMFWFRAASLQRIARANLTDFETEAGQVDGTMAHAYERLFALVAERLGYVTLTRTELLGIDLGQYAALPVHERVRRDLSFLSDERDPAIVSRFVSGFEPRRPEIEHRPVPRSGRPLLRRVAARLPPTVKLAIRRMLGI